MKAGDKLQVLLRPEDLRIEEIKESEEKGIVGHVTDRTYKGMTLESVVELESGMCVMVSEFFNEDDPDVDHSIGQKVAVTWVESWEVVLNDEQKLNLQNAIVTLIVGWLVLFVLIPNLMIIGTSFLTRDEANLIKFAFTFENYTRLLDPLYGKVMLHSFYMAIVATLICLVIGYPFAYIVAKMPEKWRPFMLFLIIVPFWTNSLIRTYGLKIVLGTQGILNQALMSLGLIDAPLRIMFTETAVMIGLVYILLPFMILPLYSAIEKLDGTYIEAARDLGANKFQTLVRVILPLTMPGIIGGCLLVLLLPSVCSTSLTYSAVRKTC